MTDLTEPSSSPDLLDRLAETKLRELSLVAQGAAGKIGGSETARLKPEGNSPRPVDDPVTKLKERYERAVSNAARLDVIKEIQDVTVNLKYSPAPLRVRGTLDWKIAVASDSRSSHVVGRAYGISPSYVRKLRKAKRDGRLREISDSGPLVRTT